MCLFCANALTSFSQGSIPILGWRVVMVLNQAKLRRNNHENSRKCTKQSICFQCLGKIGDLQCHLCEIKIHQPRSGIETRNKQGASAP